MSRKISQKTYIKDNIIVNVLLQKRLHLLGVVFFKYKNKLKHQLSQKQVQLIERITFIITLQSIISSFSHDNSMDLLHSLTTNSS